MVRVVLAHHAAFLEHERLFNTTARFIPRVMNLGYQQVIERFMAARPVDRRLDSLRPLLALFLPRARGATRLPANPADFLLTTLPHHHSTELVR